jgi:hypothetical protein
VLLELGLWWVNLECAVWAGFLDETGKQSVKFTYSRNRPEVEWRLWSTWDRLFLRVAPESLTALDEACGVVLDELTTSFADAPVPAS